MIRTSCSESGYRSSNDDLEKHCDRDDGVAECVADVGPALAGLDLVVDAFVAARELCFGGLFDGLLAAEPVSGRLWRLRRWDSERAVEDFEGVGGFLARDESDRRLDVNCYVSFLVQRHVVGT